MYKIKLSKLSFPNQAFQFEAFSSLVMNSKTVAWIGSILIVVTVFVSYYGSIRIGFLGDDWWFLGKAATLNLPEYIKFYFDPAAQIFWYRPLYGILLLLEYGFFRSSPEGYHIGQIALHAINSLLLFAVVWQLSQRRRLALVSALLYAVLPVNNLAIFWIAVQDPLSMLFYLASVWCWVIHLQTGGRYYAWLAFGAFILALLGKESSVFLPVTLFLIDWLLVSKHSTPREWVRRYAPFGIALLVYLVVEQRVQTYGYFPNRWGYGIGVHILENLARYGSLSIFPWGEDLPVVSYILLALALAILIPFGIWKRSRWLLFFAIELLLTIAPALAFPTAFFQARYLYFAAAVTATLLALFVELIANSPIHRRWAIAAPLIAVVFVLASSSMTFAAADKRAEEARQMRVPIRDIFQQHPAYPPGTLLYFVEPPYPMIMRNLSGMFLMRYGPGVNVWSNDAEWGGVDEDRFAHLRDYAPSWVYYFDESGNRHEIAVDPVAPSSASPSPPLNFQNGIRLEGFEVTGTRLKHGQDLALLLYWRPTEKIDRDYTVFVHWIDEKGETVYGEDMPPRGNRAPTSRWVPNKLVADVHILTIVPDLPPGKYHLDVGLYFLPTQQRLEILDDRGIGMTDHVVIDSFEVVE